MRKPAKSTNLPPEIVDAIGAEFEAMGFNFDPEAFGKFGGVETIGLGQAAGLSPDEIAHLINIKVIADRLERLLPKCVEQIGDCTYVSMPLDDLRCAHGFLTLVKADVIENITAEQFKQAVTIVCRLEATSNGEPKKRKRTGR